MNIARTELVRFDDQHRDQPDDRRVRFIDSNCFGAITNRDIDAAGSAIKFRARLSDLFTRNQPDLFEHFQHIIVVSLQGELIPVMPFKRTNLALWCQRATRFIRSALADFAEQILEDKRLILVSNGITSWRNRQWLWPRRE